MQLKDFKNKKITIMGLGLLGRGVGDAKFLVELGAKVTVTDLKSRKELKTSLDKLKGLPIKYVLGEHKEEDFINADMILRNPDVPYDSKYLEIARKHNVPVEMDDTLFFQNCNAPIIGITGTRGKTTTTTLISEIFKKAGKDVIVGGNIKGIATFPLVKRIKKSSVVVLELSSWQLQGYNDHKFSPHVSVITNIYEDHLNRYKNMEEYIEDKKAIFKYQNKNDFLVLNYDNKYTRNFAKEVNSQVYFFSIKKQKIWSKDEKCDKIVTDKYFSDIKLKGRHNRENILACFSVCKILDIDEKIFWNTVKNFKGIEHRLELIREVDGIQYINDTTSTTPAAAIAALNSFDKPIILLAGGASKNLDLNEFAKEIVKRVKAIILLNGTATDELKRKIVENNGKKIISERFDNFKNAILKAKSLALKGDIILLSPGCASFGMFKNEFDRGEQFRKIVSGI